MNKHITDNEFEIYLLDKLKLSIESIEFINDHLTKCSLCNENYEKLISFYSHIDKNLNEKFDDDEKIAERILAQNKSKLEKKLLEENNRAVSISHGSFEIVDQSKKSVINWIGDYLRYNPLKFSGSLAIIGAIVFSFFYFKRPEIKNVNPALAVIENNVLNVYNEMGEILWRKGAVGMHNYRSDQLFEDQRRYSNIRELLLEDIDADGMNEILIAGNGSGNVTFARDSLYCYDNTGKLKWKYGCGGFVTFNAPRWKHENWWIANFIISKTKMVKRIFVIATTTFAPTKLFELDIKTGKVVQEFYNSGGITTAATFDLDEDGEEEIYIGGINNAFKSAFIAVFNSDSVTGFSPSTELYIPHEHQKNSCLNYILIPHTEYGRMVSNSDYNSVDNFILSKETRTITAYVQEVPAPGKLIESRASILYNFGKDMKLNSVVPGDDFTSNYNRFYNEGKLKEPLDYNYIKKLEVGVRYLK
jgi:hypothetical protein